MSKSKHEWQQQHVESRPEYHDPVDWTKVAEDIVRNPFPYGSSITLPTPTSGTSVYGPASSTWTTATRTPYDDLLDKMAALEEHVRWIRPDLPLHEEYAELRELYDQYIAKRDEIREKIKMWDVLKK